MFIETNDLSLTAEQKIHNKVPLQWLILLLKALKNLMFCFFSHEIDFPNALNFLTIINVLPYTVAK